MAGKPPETGGIQTHDAIAALYRSYETPHTIAIHIENLLHGDDTDRVVEKLPPDSPWRDASNIHLLAERVSKTGRDDKTRLGSKRPSYVIAERITDAIDDSLPLTEQPPDSYHLALSRVATHVLADEELASNRSIIAWVSKMLEGGQDAHLGPGLAAIVRNASFSTLEHSSDLTCEMIYSRADDPRTLDLWKNAAVRIAWSRRSSHPDRLFALLEKIESLDEKIVQVFFGEVLHPNLDGNLRNRMLRHTIRLAGFMQARTLLSKLGDPSHVKLIPGLVSVGKNAPNTATQRAILAACTRIGSPIAEPLVIELLQHPSSGMRHNAVDAAGALGTRRCLEHLLEIEKNEEGGELAEKARDAITAIEQRYPAAKYAVAGGLSLSDEGGSRGALSLILPDEGAISLYEEVERALKTPPREQTSDNLPQVSASTTDLAPAWYRLEVAPRKVPFSTRAELFYRQNLTGALSFVFLGIAALMVWIPNAFTIPHLWIFMLVGLITGTFAKHRMDMRSRALELGHPSYADHQGCEYETQGNNKILVHKFGYMTEEGDYIEQKRKFEGKLLPQLTERQLEERPTSPILYLTDVHENEREQSTNVVFIDEFKSIQVGQSGELEASVLWAGLFGTMAVMQLLTIVSFLARIISFFL